MTTVLIVLAILVYLYFGYRFANGPWGIPRGTPGVLTLTLIVVWLPVWWINIPYALNGELKGNPFARRHP